MSRRLYAVDLGSLRPDRGWWKADAVWFRRKDGITAACIGYLHDLQEPAPADAAEFLRRYTDGRNGGQCEGRWDGEGYWGAYEAPEVMAEHLALLRPMLDTYPAIPTGYDGWWKFEGAR